MGARTRAKLQASRKDVTFTKIFSTVDDTATTAEDTPKVFTQGDLKGNDWVTVKWKMADKPRKAYEVIVLPPKSEAGEDL